MVRSYQDTTQHFNRTILVAYRLRHREAPSPDRSPQFAIRTSVWQQNDKRRMYRKVAKVMSNLEVESLTDPRPNDHKNNCTRSNDNHSFMEVHNTSGNMAERRSETGHPQCKSQPHWPASRKERARGSGISNVTSNIELIPGVLECLKTILRNKAKVETQNAVRFDRTLTYGA